MRAGAPESPGLLSPAHSEASSGVVTTETLSNKVSQLRRSRKEYRAALERFTHNLGELGLDQEDVPSCWRLALGQRLLDRRQEEAKTVEQVEAEMECLGRLEIGQDDVEGEGIEV